MKNKKNLGFTLMEAVIGIAIFGILIVGVLGVFGALERTTKGSREQIQLATLASSYLEVVRNLPYNQVGTIAGNPNGSLPDYTSPIYTTLENKPYKIYYEVIYLDDPADGTILAGTDSAPNDYKQVKLTIQNTTTGHDSDFITNISPQNLESLNNAGALLIKVINAQGNPVPGATVQIITTTGSPTINLLRTADSTGTVLEVGLPARVNSYFILVTKQGYSSDYTSAITAGNPNPIKPHSTILNGQVTQVSFAIDQTSTLSIKTVNTTCQVLDSINVNVLGAKKIGVNPDVFKYSTNYASSAGSIDLNGMEWDTYTPTLLLPSSYAVIGTSPMQQITILPSTSQVFTLVLGPRTTNSLLTLVKDSATRAPIEGATVTLQAPGNPAVSGTTGGSVWTQNNWSGGSGQDSYSATDKYASDSSTIDVNQAPGALMLKQFNGTYQNSGSLESSTFDTGTNASNYSVIWWSPTSQSNGTAVKFQLATSNNSSGPWAYYGPDGTSATYYTTPGTTINSVHDNNRYIRYKVYLSTSNTALTPVLSSVSINYVSGCFTPGQTYFSGLTAASNYVLTVTMPGYQTATFNNVNINGNQTLDVEMNP